MSTHRKARRRELTAKQKADNEEFSNKRIFVERIIRLVKIFQVARQRLTLNYRTYEQIILTICGLIRLRIGTLILPFS